ncbi:hypothetical protein [Stenoxybacter acetivorans]|uniref:hypothetical protein n=1 Tax=Stenoxybacter acetivorans TaxID=422441 RepID=UPI000561A0B0|nr:hypothetical protein [Stenoxybacter acetivorans]
MENGYTASMRSMTREQARRNLPPGFLGSVLLRPNARGGGLSILRWLGFISRLEKAGKPKSHHYCFNAQIGSARIHYVEKW